MGNDSITMNNYIQNRIDGTEVRTFQEFRKDTRQELIDKYRAKATKAAEEVRAAANKTETTKSHKR